MKLPPELRNQIYGLVLLFPRDIDLESKTKRHRRTVERYTDPSWPPLVPNILLLNQAIYTEAQPILYAGNSFIVEDTTAMHAFLANIGPKNRANITDLTIRGWGYQGAQKAMNHSALTMLVDAVNLRRLQLDCGKIGWRDPKRNAMQLYRAGFHWLEAMGAGKGKFDTALDIIKLPDGALTWGCDKAESGRILDERMEVFRAELRRLLSCKR